MKNYKNIFLDTEFDENPHGMTDLISVGLVSECGKEYYAELVHSYSFYNDPWLTENVVPHLTGKQKEADIISFEVINFLKELSPNTDSSNFIRLWAWKGTYDWYLMINLLGGFKKVPAFIPKTYFELANHYSILNNLVDPNDILKSEKNHNALEDAKWNMKLFNNLEKEKINDINLKLDLY